MSKQTKIRLLKETIEKLDSVASALILLDSVEKAMQIENWARELRWELRKLETEDVRLNG